MAVNAEPTVSWREYVDSRFKELREYVDTRFDAQGKAVSAALAAQEKAVFVAETNSEKWRASANEWRGAMDDREESFVKIGEYNLLLAQVKENRDQVTTLLGRGQGRGDVWGWVTAGIVLLLAIASLFYKVAS
jgi:hypothetical protein